MDLGKDKVELFRKHVFNIELLLFLDVEVLLLFEVLLLILDLLILLEVSTLGDTVDFCDKCSGIMFPSLPPTNKKR